MFTVRIGGPSVGGFGSYAGFPRTAPVACSVELTPGRADPAPRPEPRAIASGLKAPLMDGQKPRVPLLAAVEAARAFSAGTFLLPGQIIDRSI